MLKLGASGLQSLLDKIVIINTIYWKPVKEAPRFKLRYIGAEINHMKELVL